MTSKVKNSCMLRVITGSAMIVRSAATRVGWVSDSHTWSTC